MNRKNTIGLAALIAGLLPITAEAGTLDARGSVSPTSAPPVHQSTGSDISGQLSAVKIKTRPCLDFLKAQGTTSQFFSPVPDYVGWTDAVNPITGLPDTFGLVDYAGLADKYIKAQTGKSLGTNVTCLVTEGALADGSGKITVALVATKALGFAQCVADLNANAFDFLKTPTIFGAKVVTTAPGETGVVNGADPALGPATLDASASRKLEAPCRTSWTSSSITGVTTRRSTIASDPSRTEGRSCCTLSRRLSRQDLPTA